MVSAWRAVRCIKARCYAPRYGIRGTQFCHIYLWLCISRIDLHHVVYLNLYYTAKLPVSSNANERQIGRTAVRRTTEAWQGPSMNSAHYLIKRLPRAWSGNEKIQRCSPLDLLRECSAITITQNGNISHKFSCFHSATTVTVNISVSDY